MTLIIRTIPDYTKCRDLKSCYIRLNAGPSNVAKIIYIIRGTIVSRPVVHMGLSERFLRVKFALTDGQQSCIGVEIQWVCLQVHGSLR